MPPPEGKVTYPVTLETQRGQVTIEKRPERLVADDYGAELLAVLGVTVVGTNASVNDAPWIKDNVPGKIETIWNSGEMPNEDVLAARPDAITTLNDYPNAEQLGEIAPLIQAKSVQEDTWIPWQDQLRLLGTTLDLSDRAETEIAKYDKYFADIRDANPGFAQLSLSYLTYYENNGRFHNRAGNPPAAYFERLGFKPSPDAPDFETNNEVSAELVGTLKADVLVIGSDTEYEGFDEFFNDELMASTPAGQNNRVIKFVHSQKKGGITFNGKQYPASPGAIFATFYGGPFGQIALTEALLPILKDGLGR